MYKIWILLLALTWTTVTANWDLAVGVSHNVELLAAEESKETVEVISVTTERIDTLGYDSIRNQLYIVDRSNKDHSIFRVNLTQGMSRKLQPIVTKQDTVRGIAVDPITETLYWTTSNAIKWLKMTNDSFEPQEGSELFTFKDELPHGIAVDVCTRSLYWTNKNSMNPTIERSTLNGEDRKVLLNITKRMPIVIFVDQSTKRIFWSEEDTGIGNWIGSSDFDGKHSETHVELDHLPLTLAVIKNEIFWLDSTDNKALMKTGFNVDKNNKFISKGSSEIVRRFATAPFGIVSAQQDFGLDREECSIITEKKKQVEMAGVKNTNLEQDEHGKMFADSVYCLNHGTFTDNGTCACPMGYGGSRCELAVCYNFCVQGDCKVIGGAARCQCPPGWTGLRCETNLCKGRCLNGGKCSVDRNSELHCNCTKGFTGNQCQRKLPDTSSSKMCIIYCHMQELTEEYRELLLETEHIPAMFTKRPDLCSCPQHSLVSKMSENCTSNSIPIGEMSADGVCTQGGSLNGSNNFNTVLLYTLSALCLLLFTLVAVLVSKIWSLRKRPRIKKRIIVNKSVTPLTCRPQSASEQCEITIENCCNMNICETAVEKMRNENHEAVRARDTEILSI